MRCRKKYTSFLLHEHDIGLSAQARDDLPPVARQLVDEGVTLARSAIDELRELAHGIPPALLTHHGLAAAVDGLADRAPLPVDVDIPDDRYPAAVESAAYFVAAEALTNVAKYAHAEHASVQLTLDREHLFVQISDDGIGGADPTIGTGLRGLRDRVEARDGSFDVESPPGTGTTVRVELPLDRA
jgi:signal transduction histidine kinase